MTQARDRFQIKRPQIGGGAFGLVYQAYDTELKRQVAIKVPHDSEKEKALRKEAQLMARILDLNEIHVVKLYDLHEINGQRVIVMEYVEGDSLRKKLGEIGRQHPLELKESLRIAIEACLGLRTLHNAFVEKEKSAGIFHRDVKPENILIRSDGLVKIADFGIAKILESSGLASSTVGTLPYMAPESLEGNGADYRADIYGLGVTVYEMITGRLPFSPFDHTGRVKAPLVYGREICQGNPPAPASVADVDEELSDIVLKAMRCSVNERYQSMDELMGALERYQSRILASQIIAAAWKELESEKSEELLKDLIRRYPENPDGYRNLAWFYNRHLRFYDALRMLEEGRIHCNRCGELLVDLAQVYHKIGEVRRAIETLESACKLPLPKNMKDRSELLLKAWKKRGGA